MLSSAAPIEPPICWPVDTIAEATPASDWRTPAVAEFIDGAMIIPIPRPITIRPGQHVGRVAGVDADAGEQEHADRRERPCPTVTSGRGPTRGKMRVVEIAGGDHQRGDHRQEREPGADRRVAERRLQVEGQEQEHAEHAGAGDGDRQVRAAAVAVEDDAQRQERLGDPALDEHERRRAARRRRRAGPASAGPSSRRCRRGRSRTPGRTGRSRRSGARDVDPPRRRARAVVDQRQRAERRRHARRPGSRTWPSATTGSRSGRRRAAGRSRHRRRRSRRRCRTPCRAPCRR